MCSTSPSSHSGSSSALSGPSSLPSPPSYSPYGSHAKVSSCRAKIKLYHYCYFNYFAGIVRVFSGALGELCGGAPPPKAYASVEMKAVGESGKDNTAHESETVKADTV